jgi:hypothetical protein
MWNILLLALSSVTGLSHPVPASNTASVLWTEPQPKTTADWIWGPGGESRAPRPPFRFVKEILNGTNAKIEVTDAAGARWVVKFGGEVHTETFAARLLSAVGYTAAATYFVPDGTVSGVSGLKRARPFISRQGAFRSARFQLRDGRGPAFSKDLNWSWNNNPFDGSHELNGLKILMILMSNWDAKDERDGEGSNTAVFVEAAPQSTIYHYAFTDWGATLGRWGGLLKRDRWDLQAYRRDTRDFVKGVRNGAIVWGYRGKHNDDIVDGITVDDVRWLLPYLERITSEQLRSALIASGATAAHAQGFAQAIENRITQLQRIAETGGSN